MNRIINRYLLIIGIIAAYFLMSYALFPNSFFGLNYAFKVISHLADLNNNGDSSAYIWENVGSTMLRFAFSVSLVVTISLALIYVFHRWKWSLMLLDHFSESLRTVPATAWAYPLAILPVVFLNSEWALFIAVVLSTSPVLTLGLYKVYIDIYDSLAYRLAIRNNLKKKIINIKFIPWLILHSIVHFKTAIALIFIIVIVLEDVLKGFPISRGLGIVIGNLHSMDYNGSARSAAGLFLLVVLTFISVSISTAIDLLDEIFKEK